MGKSFFSIYMLFLGVMIGIEIAVGALMAPVIFFPASFIGEGVLSHYQSGILMTQVFLRFNMILLFMTFFGTAYEMYLFKSFKRDKWAIALSLVVLYCALMFVFYYTPFIVEAQEAGVLATQTEAFAKMHQGSEIDIKVLMMAQLALFMRRMWLGRV